MSADAMWQLQKAVYSKLTSDTNLMTLVNNNIFENVPEETPFPFIAISDFEAVIEEQTEKDLYLINFFIDSFTRQKGSKASLDIIKNIETALFNSSIVVTGYDVLNIRVSSSACKKMSDGNTYIGSLKMRAMIKQA